MRNPELQEKLTTEALDYIYRGVGDAEEIAERTGIDKNVLEEMRREFLYWYPVDLRVSA